MTSFETHSAESIAPAEGSAQLLNQLSPPQILADVGAELESHYTHYLDPAFPLADRFQAAMNELEIGPEQQEKIHVPSVAFRLSKRSHSDSMPCVLLISHELRPSFANVS